MNGEGDVEEQDACQNFDEWLSDVTKVFEEMSLKNKRKTIHTFLNHCSPEQKYCLLSELSSTFHHDILVSLPLELKEQICHYVDVKSLLTACSVSKEWNGMISSMRDVWRRKCKQFGIHSLRMDSSSWKGSCVNALRLLAQITSGAAFQHRDISASCLTRNQVSGVDYCHGFLIGSADDQIGIWRAEDYELILLFQVPYRISCLQLSNNNLLAVGHSTGHITIWTLETTKGFYFASPYNEYRGHTGVVMSLSVSTDIDIMVSGSTDFSAKVWCISTGHLLKSLITHTHWVVQVTILPTLTKKNNKTLLTGQHSLLTVTRDHVKIFSWNVVSREKKMYGDISMIEDSVIEFPLNSVHRFFTPGCHIIAGNAVYVRQSLVKDDEEGNAEIIFQNLHTRKCIRKVRLARKVRKLLAVGEKYALLLLPHSHFSEFNLLVVELATGNIIGGCHLPHSSSTTPDLAQVAIGEVGWLSDLSQQKQDELVISLGLINERIRVVTWRNMKATYTG